MTKRDRSVHRAASAPNKDVTCDEPVEAAHDAGNPWSLAARLVASALILFQITAIFCPPFAFASTAESGTSSPFADGVMGWLRPYTSLMFLDHGYSFFAPRIVGGHLVHYKVEFADGRAQVEGTFPDKQDQRPRLMYHRYFMLAEALNDAYTPPEPPLLPSLPADVPALLRRQFEQNRERQLVAMTAIWKQRRDRYEQLHKSFEEHLLAKHGGSKVTLTRQEHVLLDADDYLQLGKRLDLPETYVDLPEANLTEVIRP
jgi:hypothetical protein